MNTSLCKLHGIPYFIKKGIGIPRRIRDCNFRRLDEEETDPHKNIDHELFIANSKNKYGYKGAREASELLSRASALFAGGELDDNAKELFFQSLMEVYLDSKQEAREKFSPKKRARKSKNL